MFGRKRKLEDFSSEIEAHLQLEIERLREQGLSEEEARASARRSLSLISACPRSSRSSLWQRATFRPGALRASIR
jgi:hypothetical protein